MPKPYYEDSAVTLYHGDCREVLPALADDSVDVVLTDPPYNVGKNYGVNDDRMEPEDYRAWLSGVLGECGRASRDGVVWFPGTTNALHVSEVALAANVRPYRLLGWHKKEFAGDKWRGGPAMCWEPIMWATVVEKPFFNTIFGKYGRDFFVVNATHGDPLAKHHPCPKPYSVVRWLLGLFAPAGGTILDPFAGSGTTLLAAKNMHLRAVGIELNEAYCELTASRLSQEVLPLEGA